MVDLLELALLRILNEKNSERALEFPVRAFSELSQFNFLTLEELAEITELDAFILQPIVKKLVKQRIFKNKQGKISVNKRLHSINKLLD